jgi:hypothetical protein
MVKRKVLGLKPAKPRPKVFRDVNIDQTPTTREEQLLVLWTKYGCPAKMKITVKGEVVKLEEGVEVKQ